MCDGFRYKIKDEKCQLMSNVICWLSEMDTESVILSEMG